MALVFGLSSLIRSKVCGYKSIPSRSAEFIQPTDSAGNCRPRSTRPPDWRERTIICLIIARLQGLFLILWVVRTGKSLTGQGGWLVVNHGELRHCPQADISGDPSADCKSGVSHLDPKLDKN